MASYAIARETSPARSIPAAGFQAGYVRFEDLSEIQLLQARDMFLQFGPLGLNYLYLIDSADGRVHGRKHKSGFSFAELQSIGVL